EGLAQLPFEAAEAATNQMSLRVGEIFDEDEFEKAKQEVANALADRGYAYAQVTGSAQIDLASRGATVTIVATPGKRATLGEIRIIGLSQIEERPVRRTLLLEEGDQYSRKELNSARSALFSLGVFASVEIEPTLDSPDNPVVPLTVRVQEAAMRDVTVGGGARLDLL